MGLDIVEHGWGKHVRARGPGRKALSQTSRRDVFMDRLQQMDATALVRSQAEGRNGPRAESPVG